MDDKMPLGERPDMAEFPFPLSSHQVRMHNNSKSG